MVLLLAALTFAREGFQRTPDFLPVSVWYSGGTARAPMLSTITPESREQWRRDLAQIKSLGFNTVRTWVEWAHCEPRPGNTISKTSTSFANWPASRGARHLPDVHRLGAGLGGQALPRRPLEAQSGDKVTPQSAPGCCTDHAGVQDAVLTFFTETAKRAMKHPNFHGWDLWSETHIINWAYINYVPNATFCYCPHTMQFSRSGCRKSTPPSRPSTRPGTAISPPGAR
jgi:beta-galactosidase